MTVKPTEPGADRERPVVYIVDDDDSVRRALRRLIRSMGMRAEAFASPEELLRSDLSDPVGCLLLDVQLPGMNGFELHERFVEAGYSAPVIFITAHPDAGSRARASRADAVAYLEKPFDDGSLLQALETALDRISKD